MEEQKKRTKQRERERVESVAVVVVVVVASVVPARRNRPANRIVCVEERKKKDDRFRIHRCVAINKTGGGAS